MEGSVFNQQSTFLIDSIKILWKKEKNILAFLLYQYDAEILRMDIIYMGKFIGQFVHAVGGEGMYRYLSH